MLGSRAKLLAWPEGSKKDINDFYLMNKEK
jgi:hypothetical protein